MNRKLRPLIIIISAFFVLLFLTKSYSWFCRSTGSCQALALADYIPRPEGNVKYNISLEVRNYRRDIDFQVISSDTISTVTGRKIITKYKVTNVSNNFVKYRPQIYIETDNDEKMSIHQYLMMDECLCFRNQKIKKGGEVILYSVFRLHSGLDSDLKAIFGESKDYKIKMGYVIH